MDDEIIRLAVFGMTGAGKTSFVTLATGSDFKIGHDGSSCTKNVQIAVKPLGDGRTVALYDTPGFDDSEHEDEQIFEDLAKWLATSEKVGKRLNGVIFMQPITNARIADSERQKLQLFKQIVGRQYYHQVVIVTTMWDTFNHTKGKMNEKNRTDSVWNDMIACGAEVLQFKNTEESAASIVKHFTSNPGSFPPESLLLQQELRMHKGRLRETRAAKQLEGDIGKKVEDLRLQIRNLGGSEKLENMVQKMQGWLQRLRSAVVSRQIKA
ncbi:P-loop containing nucleoside triphosphate hydrolase protein [Lasiosphaeris hirsuta]|uniref:P-loop containing nucleoside triphosphate hydrolase protein n=1 Tax=Lasiosphaeris hirsuta TaxID=260670 RepID=A0AA40DY72_9PEZI|nr:P-loop containing nucleoside triphosphate hydrolase protein [Lasiosphaeris hirsuta]